MTNEQRAHDLAMLMMKSTSVDEKSGNLKPDFFTQYINAYKMVKELLDKNYPDGII
jgi:hypothetical protein